MYYQSTAKFQPEPPKFIVTSEVYRVPTNFEFPRPNCFWVNVVIVIMIGVFGITVCLTEPLSCMMKIQHVFEQQFIFEPGQARFKNIIFKHWPVGYTCRTFGGTCQSSSTWWVGTASCMW